MSFSPLPLTDSSHSTPTPFQRGQFAPFNFLFVDCSPFPPFFFLPLPLLYEALRYLPFSRPFRIPIISNLHSSRFRTVIGSHVLCF